MKTKKNTQNIRLIIFTLVFFCFTQSFCYAQQNFWEPSHIIGEDEENIELKIDSIVSQLTLKEKVDMCHAQSKFSTKGVPRLGIPEIWMSDGPHGVRAEIKWDDWGYAEWTNDSVTAFPALTCLASTFNPELSGEYGFSVGEEARYRKKDILLGPGVNIYRTPLNGRNFEYMGEDPLLASKMVVPYIKGVQKNGVAACVKHFALNNQELWRDQINVEVSDRALHEIYLPAFKAAAIEGKAWSFMGSYNKFRGQYCCHNDILLNQILKGDWKFDGVVVSDWSGAHSTKESALYGLDIEMGTGTDGLGTTTASHYQHYFLATPYYNKLLSNELPEASVNDKVKRILRLMYRTTLQKNRPRGKMNNKEHHGIAKKVATEGIVLLKNENDFFPIQDKSGLKIAVIGENATRSMTLGGGSSQLKAQFEISPLEGLKKKYKNAKIYHSMGYETGPSIYDTVMPASLDADSLKVAAVNLAKKVDVVLFFGGLNKSHLQDSEGTDRKQFGLPFGQDELLGEIQKENKNVGYILMTGNAVEMPWIDSIDGLIETWYLGSMAGEAIADIIIGDTTPSGKLPFSFPAKLEDNAAHSFGEISYPGDSDLNQHYKEDILVGYRWHDTKNIKPLFAFGHGLSYTSFEVSNIKIDKTKFTTQEHIELHFDVTNTGNRKGAEVVQVYVGKPNSNIKRAVKELKGFQKVHLENGEKKNISMTIPVSSLSFYDEQISDWNIEKGKYNIYVGTASDNILKEITITLK